MGPLGDDRDSRLEVAAGFDRRDDLGKEEARPSYAVLATELSIAVTDVTNYLAFARREFRRCVLEQLREMTGSEEEFRREALFILGVDAK